MMDHKGESKGENLMDSNPFTFTFTFTFKNPAVSKQYLLQIIQDPRSPI